STPCTVGKPARTVSASFQNHCRLPTAKTATAISPPPTRTAAPRSTACRPESVRDTSLPPWAAGPRPLLWPPPQSGEGATRGVFGGTLLAPSPSVREEGAPTPSLLYWAFPPCDAPQAEDCSPRRPGEIAAKGQNDVCTRRPALFMIDRTAPEVLDL